MKKLLVYIIIILFLTGCTIKNSININYDGKVTEEISVLNNSSNFDSSEHTFEELMDSNISQYKKTLDFRKYTYEYIKGNKLSGIKFNKTYTNICDYFGNSAFNQYVYKYIDCKETDEYYEIKNATDYIPYCVDCSEWPALDNIEYKITLPVSAIEQNADEIDGTTYIWKYNKDTENKNFYLKISKSKLKEYKQDYEIKVDKKNRIKKITIISIVLGVIVVLVLLGMIMYKKVQKNKFDY